MHPPARARACAQGARWEWGGRDAWARVHVRARGFGGKEGAGGGGRGAYPPPPQHAPALTFTYERAHARWGEGRGSSLSAIVPLCSRIPGCTLGTIARRSAMTPSCRPVHSQAALATSGITQKLFMTPGELSSLFGGTSWKKTSKH